jgi:sarcosine oxidase subunit gamma
MAAAGAASGLTFSQLPCRAVEREDRAALWLGPDEQLLLAPAESAHDLSESLQNALRTIPHSLVDIGHRQIALEVSGPHVSVILNSGCPLDLDIDVFKVGSCTRTVMAKAAIVLWRRRQDVFEMEVGRSFAGYVSAYLREAAGEISG